MSRGKRIALILLIALVLIVVGLAIVVPMLFNIDRYRPQVVAEIQAATGKPTQIGRLALTILPEVAIRVDDFSLGNPPGFPPGNFVTTRKIYVVVKPFELLHRRIEITSLLLSDLTLDLLEDTRGKWNFENAPAGALEPASYPPAHDGIPFALGTISRLTIVRGQLAAASLLTLGVPGPALISIRNAAIDLRQVNLMAFSSVSLRKPASAVPVLATLAALLSPPTAYAADLQGPTVAEGIVRADALHFGNIETTKLQSKVRLYPKQTFFDDLDLKCYGGTLWGNLFLDFAGPKLSYRTDTRVKGVNVERLLAAFPQAKGMMTGTLDASAKMNGTVLGSSDPFAGISASGQVSVRGGRLPSLQLASNLRTLAKMANLGPANGDPSSFSSLSADFRIADSRLSSDRISLVGEGVDIDGSGNLTTAGEGTLAFQGDASLAASGSNPLTSILGGLTGAKFAKGKLTFPFTVGGTFAKPKFSLKGG